jgi:hypothetical protein
MAAGADIPLPRPVTQSPLSPPVIFDDKMLVDLARQVGAERMLNAAAAVEAEQSRDRGLNGHSATSHA